MQLTRFDRWLLESFIQETHIYTLSPPPSLPRGIREIPMPENPSRRYQHHFASRKGKATNKLIAMLRQSGQMFSTQVVERPVWYAPFIAPKGRSVTWRLVWGVLTCIGVFWVTIYLKGLWDNPEFRNNLIDAKKVLEN